MKSETVKPYSVFFKPERETSNKKQGKKDQWVKKLTESGTFTNERTVNNVDVPLSRALYDKLVDTKVTNNLTDQLSKTLFKDEKWNQKHGTHFGMPNDKIAEKVSITGFKCLKLGMRKVHMRPEIVIYLDLGQIKSKLESKDTESYNAYKKTIRLNIHLTLWNDYRNFKSYDEKDMNILHEDIQVCFKKFKDDALSKFSWLEALNEDSLENFNTKHKVSYTKKFR